MNVTAFEGEDVYHDPGHLGFPESQEHEVGNGDAIIDHPFPENLELMTEKTTRSKGLAPCQYCFPSR